MPLFRHNVRTRWALLISVPLILFGFTSTAEESVPAKGEYRILLEIENDLLPPSGAGVLSTNELVKAQGQITKVIWKRLSSLGHTNFSLTPDTRAGHARMLLRVGDMTEKDLLKIKDLATRRGYLQFRAVHPDSDLETEKWMQAGKSPPGFSVEEVKWRSATTGRDHKELLLFLVPDSGPNPLSEEERTKRQGEESAALPHFESKPGYDLLYSEEVHNGKTYYSPVYVDTKELIDG